MVELQGPGEFSSGPFRVRRVWWQPVGGSGLQEKRPHVPGGWPEPCNHGTVIASGARPGSPSQGGEWTSFTGEKMSARRTPSPRLLSVAGLGLLLALGMRGVPAGGTSDPCNAPLAWRIAEVDPRFGLTPEEAVEATLNAAGLWHTAAGRILFVHDAADGFPIRFVYDERQAGLQARARHLDRLDPQLERLEGRQQELKVRADSLTHEGVGLEADARDFTARFADHNRTVARWNREGGGPAARQEELVAAARRLGEERRVLLQRQAEFDTGQATLWEDATELEEDIEAHNREAEAVDRAFPGGLVESGRFVAMTRRGRLADREIRIYRFQEADDLTLVLAHELGHALGLGHIPGSGGIMSPVAEREPGSEGRSAPRVSRADLHLLSALCAG